MKKSTLASSIAACLGVAATQTFAIDAPIDNMNFDGNFAAQGTLSSSANNFSHIESVDLFFRNHWAAAAVAYFEPGLAPTEDLDLATDEGNVTNGAVPAIFDDPLVNGLFSQTLTDNGTDGNGDTMYTWSGFADQVVKDDTGAVISNEFAYDFTLEPNEVAWGTLFNWNSNAGIPVLVIVDCLSFPGVACVGRGTPMVTAPFAGSAPAFSSGPLPLVCQDPTQESTTPDTPIEIDKANLLSLCEDGSGVASITGVDGTSAEGGSIADNGTTYTYAPGSGFEGADSFSYTVSDDLFTVMPTQTVQVGGELQGNFTIMKSDGGTFGGANDVVFDWDQVTFNTDESDNNFDIIKITSNTPFFDVQWTAHHIRVYDGGVGGRTISFDTTCTVVQLDAGTSVCGGSTADMMELVIPPNTYGAHINFDWNGNTNIDVVNVWEPNGKWDDPDGPDGVKNNLFQGPLGVTPDVSSTWELASKDVNGDGINGSPMIDGPFPNNYANFSWKADTVAASCEDRGLVTLEGGVCGSDSTISEVSTPTLSLNFWALLTGFVTLMGIRKVKYNK